MMAVKSDPFAPLAGNDFSIEVYANLPRTCCKFPEFSMRANAARCTLSETPHRAGTAWLGMLACDPNRKTWRFAHDSAAAAPRRLFSAFVRGFRGGIAHRSGGSRKAGAAGTGRRDQSTHRR